jgi:tRNA modification GTPase
MRESDDEVEREGMKRTRQALARADIALHVFDASQPPDRALEALQTGGPALAVLNKTDLGVHAGWRKVDGVRISCLKGEGIEALAEAIVTRVAGGSAAHRDWSLAINARHADCLRRACAFIEAAREAFMDGLSPEFMAEELRGALDAVGEVVGKADSEEILGKIFSTFCIGK